VSVLASARERIARYRRLPYGAVEFVREQFGAEPDPWQVDALVAFADPAIRRISLQACAGPGKSTILAWCGWYFLATQATPNGHPKGLATSITAQNLRDNLWAEFAKWHANSEFLKAAFTWSPSRIAAKDHPSTWFLSPKAWPRYVWIAADLPSTATNKILKRELIGLGVAPDGRVLWKRDGIAAGTRAFRRLAVDLA